MLESSPYSPPNPADMIAPAVLGPGNIPKAPIYMPAEIPKVETPGVNYELDMASTIGKLRQELAWNPDMSSLLQSSYGAIRSIGEMTLISNDPSGEAAQLLKATRDYGTPESFIAITAKEGNVLATHNEQDKIMGLHERNLAADTNALKDFLAKQGVELKDPSDVALFAGVNAVAHETGHSILAGISKFIINKSYGDGKNQGLRWDTRLVATRAYLKEHPEEAITGNFATDVLTHEERFAEGFGNMTLGAIMDFLGYDETVKQTVVSHLTNSTNIQNAALGTHPIDLIERINEGAGLKAVGEANGFDFYEGAIGYSMPLPIDSLVAEISGLSQMIKTTDVDKSKINVDPKVWAALIRARQSAETKQIIAGQLALRARAFVPVAQAPVGIITELDIPR